MLEPPGSLGIRITQNFCSAKDCTKKGLNVVSDEKCASDLVHEVLLHERNRERKV